MYVRQPQSNMQKLLGPQVAIERSFFRIPRISAIIGGFWPQPQRSWLTVLRFCVNTAAVALGAGGELSYGFVYLDDLFAAFEAFCPGITKAISLLKMLLFFVHHKRWLRIVQRMRALILQDSNPDKRRVIQQLASVAGILSFMLLASGSMTNAFFNILPLLKNGYRKWLGQNMLLMLPFNVYIPQMFSEYPLYPFTYAALTLSGAMTVFTFSAVDGFFVCACMYTCGLFRMLQIDLRCTFAILEELEYSSEAQNVALRRRLADIVDRHNVIIDLCAEFVAEFALIIMMYFLSAALVVCLSLLDVMLNSASIGVLTYIFYTIAATTQLFLYCIGGSYVSESSVAVSDTLYEVEWYKCDASTRRVILMMLRRSQKSITISVPFFTPSLPAFTSIISTAGSYIALLKTFI